MYCLRLVCYGGLDAGSRLYVARHFLVCGRLNRNVTFGDLRVWMICSKREWNRCRCLNDDGDEICVIRGRVAVMR